MTRELFLCVSKSAVALHCISIGRDVVIDVSVERDLAWIRTVALLVVNRVTQCIHETSCVVFGLVFVEIAMVLFDPL